MQVARCGKTRSNSGRPFTAGSLAQHERDCRECRRHATGPGAETLESLGLSLTQEIGADLPDGAYFALAHELGEW